MSFPSPLQYVLGAILLLVGIPIVYVLARALKLHPNLIAITNIKTQATLALLMVVAATVVRAVWQPFIHSIYVPAFQLENHLVSEGFMGSGSLGRTIDSYDILGFFIALSIMIFLVGIASRWTRQKIGSIGITRKNLGRNFAFGLMLGVIYLFISGLLNSFNGLHLVGFSSTLLYGLVLFAMVGFAEEIIWRGYIQTRLVARIGKLKGLVVTSLLFAILWIFPLAYYTESSGNFAGALAYSSLRIFPSLLMGYIMAKSQNIIPSSIFHFLYDFNAILWL